MKIKLLALSLLIVTGCTSLKEFGQKKNLDFSTQREFSSKSMLEQTPISLENGGVAKVLSDVKYNLKSSISKIYDVNRFDKNFDIYVGEYLKISAQGISEISILDKEYPSYSLKKEGDFYLFRSIYQGQYNLYLKMTDGTTKILYLNNKMKYKYTESDNYETIKKYYLNGLYKDASDAIDLYNMSYSRSLRLSEVNILDITILCKMKNYKEAEEKIKDIKRKNNLNEQELVSLFNSEILISNSTFNVTSYYLKDIESMPILSENIKRYLLGKYKLTQLEYRFIESLYGKTNDPALKSLLDRSNSNPQMDFLNGNQNQTISSQIPATQIPSDQLMDRGEGEVIKITDSKLSNADTQPKQEESSKIDMITKVETKDKTEEIDKEMATKKIVSTDKDTKANYTRGVSAYEKGKYNEALLYLNKAATSNNRGDEVSNIDYYIADSHFKISNYNDAINSYKKYLYSNDDSIRKAQSYYNIGVSYEKIGNKDKAIENYQKVRELYPGTSWAKKGNIAIINLKNK